MRARTIWVGLFLAASLAASPAAAQVDENDGPVHHARFRIGLEAGAGIAFGTGDSTGAAVGLLGQIGAQFTDLFGLYYNPTLYFMGFGNDVAAQGIVGTGQGGMLVLDLSQFFEIGLGSGYFFGSVGDCAATSTACSTGSFGGAILTGRIAFVIGFEAIRARIGIPISINTQTIFDGNERLTTVIAAIGLPRY